MKRQLIVVHYIMRLNGGALYCSEARFTRPLSQPEPTFEEAKRMVLDKMRTKCSDVDAGRVSIERIESSVCA